MKYLIFLSLFCFGFFTNPESAPKLSTTSNSSSKIHNCEHNNEALSLLSHPTVNDMVWSEECLLTWADFVGEPELPAYHIAASATYLHEEHGCSESGEFTYMVKAIFAPEQSWSLDKTSKELLKHEQIHFDLTEYYARLMRQMFNSLQNPCSIPQENVAALVNQLYEDLETAHDLYDDYTVHGVNKEQQHKWNVIVNRSLNQLDEYKNADLVSRR